MSSRSWRRSSKYVQQVAARRRRQARTIAALIDISSKTRRAQAIAIIPHRQVQPAALDLGVTER